MDYGVNPEQSILRWFAIWTRSRQEKAVASMLATLGVDLFLPLTTELRQWSDRKQQVSLPLFEGYLFVRVNPLTYSRLQILRAPGVVGLVGDKTGPLPIPDRQIEDIRTVLKQQGDLTVLPFLEAGDRVKVIRGPLAGIEGTLIDSNVNARLLISIYIIHQSISVNVVRGDVVPVS